MKPDPLALYLSALSSPGQPPIGNPGELRVYQRRLAEDLFQDFAKSPGALLAVEMGLGKTVTTATLARWLLDCMEVNRVLIVAPLRVAQKTWPDEFRAWEHLRRTKWISLSGKVNSKPTAAQRLKWLREFLTDPSYEVAIINRENVVWLYKTIRKLKQPWPFDMLIYDESSRLAAGKKRTATKRLSEFGVLCKVRQFFSYVVELSGTPTPRGAESLWGQISLIDLGERLLTTRTAFEEKWFNVERVAKQSGATKLVPKEGAEEEIIERSKDLIVSMKARDYIELPPVVTIDHHCDLTDAEMKQYRRFERELALEEYDILAENRGVLTNKLCQYANGAVYRQDPEDEDAPRQVIEIHDHKLRVLESIVAEANSSPILVGWSFKFDRDRIKKKFPWARDSTEEGVLEDWDEGKVRMMLTHPASIGHGMNIQRGGNILVWYGLNASLELFQQLSARLPRSGQPAERVFQHHILTRGTFDEKLVGVLQDRDATQERIKEATRRYFLMDDA